MGRWDSLTHFPTCSLLAHSPNEATGVKLVNESSPAILLLFIISIAFLLYIGWKAYRRLFRPANTEQQAAVEPGSMEEVMVRRRDNPTGLQLGYFVAANGERVPVTILPGERDTHLYICGTSDMGKSKGIKYMLLQDIASGKCLGLVDVHGDLADEITPWAVGIRSEDTIIFDPTDQENIIGFNPLELLPGMQPAEQVGQLIDAVRAIWADAWGMRTEDMVANSFYALMESNLTLLEFPRLLTDKRFRELVLQGVTNPLVHHYFEGRFDKLPPWNKSSWQDAPQNKISALLRDERNRLVLGQRQSTFNIRQIMDAGKVFVAKIPKGRIQGAHLVGALLLKLFQLCALSRQDIPPGQRRPFYLCVEESSSISTPSFLRETLRECRKFGLSVILTDQSTQFMDDQTRTAVLGNAKVHIYFRVARNDAEVLAKEAFRVTGRKIKAQDSLQGNPSFFHTSEEWEEHYNSLTSLPKRQAYLNLRGEGSLRFMTYDDPPCLFEGAQVDKSQYTKPRAAVLAEIEQRETIIEEMMEEME